MGISGLLPLLKSVQRPTHLSELSGKTVAVDAYVWLHRGAYMCATEIVTGKPTKKYIDYALRCIRLLQYYRINPFLVFDGGPLPAKKGTESERKKKRDEHLILADNFAKQGKHKQAREHYIKCVDITPQMAYQLIKALRAANIPYIVAPYEADAQLYHLECVGLVDAIMTEDSDLLIFGTKHLLLKLHLGTAACITIKADTLASNSPADFPLHGWGIKQLRECAMLSGCDYIHGVHGIGLKTASKYLRKWGTVERALRAIRMDGKFVEKDWEQRMRKAEAGFLHQRVWDPVQEEIVYLSPPDMTDWDSEKDTFIGPFIETELARKLVLGDVDPVTMEPMIDILPSFQPKTRSGLCPLSSIDHNIPDNPPKKDTLPTKGSLLQYFSKKPQHVANPLSQKIVSQAGKASGKRTLAEEYDRGRSPKRIKSAVQDSLGTEKTLSKFFSNSTQSKLAEVAFDDDKEDLEEMEDLDEDDGQPVDFDILEDIVVKQEEGYISPAFSTPDYFVSSSNLAQPVTPDFSSPLRHKGKQKRDDLLLEQNDIGNEELTAHPSSPGGSLDGRITSPSPMLLVHQNRRRPQLHSTASKSLKIQEKFDDIESVTQQHVSKYLEEQRGLTVDIGDIFQDNSEGPKETIPGSRARTPFGSRTNERLCSDSPIEGDPATRHKLVASGWEKKFSFTVDRSSSKLSKLTMTRSTPPAVKTSLLVHSNLSQSKRTPESDPNRNFAEHVEEVSDYLTSPCSEAVIMAKSLPVKSTSIAKLHAFRFK